MAARDTDGQEKKKEISGGPGQEFAKNTFAYISADVTPESFSA